MRPDGQTVALDPDSFTAHHSDDPFVAPVRRLLSRSRWDVLSQPLRQYQVMSDRTVPPGGATYGLTVIKLLFALRRLPGMTREEFLRYWLEEHGPLVRSHAPALGVRRYVQTHTLPDEIHADLRSSRDAPEPYDGVAELWFDSLESIAAVMSSPEGLTAGAALLEDERRFIDHSRSPIFLAEEHEVIAREPTGSSPSSS